MFGSQKEQCLFKLTAQVIHLRSSTLKKLRGKSRDQIVSAHNCFACPNGDKSTRNEWVQFRREQVGKFARVVNTLKVNVALTFSEEVAKRDLFNQVDFSQSFLGAKLQV